METHRTKGQQVHIHKWHGFDSYLAMAVTWVTRVRLIDQKECLFLGWVGWLVMDEKGFKCFSIVVLCALRFVFVHAKVPGFLKESAHSVFAKRFPWWHITCLSGSVAGQVLVLTGFCWMPRYGYLSGDNFCFLRDQNSRLTWMLE